MTQPAMPDVIHELYQTRVYPPMSHPVSDPALSAVAARMAGLDTPVPRSARILEIGCCSGHNLIPLAMRWPGARFTGIDLAESSILEARERVAAAGVGNIEFQAVDLIEFEPQGEPFDFIIAHGFFSWVPDEVKLGLLRFCRKHLSPSGIATVSFNLECGWKPRLPVIAKVRAIQLAGAEDEISALALLRSVTPPGDPELAIIDDMMAKGPAILAFDDFGPINDPWSLENFVAAASEAELRWLGESDPAENFPAALGDADLAALEARDLGSIEFQTSMDETLKRTFRSVILCRSDAVVEEAVLSEVALAFSFRTGFKPANSPAREIHQAIDTFAPSCVSCDQVTELLTDLDVDIVAHWMSLGIRRGWFRPRIEPQIYPSKPPDYPRLDAFRLLCARHRLPVVDAWHQPCSFPDTHYQVLSAMDGSRSLAELACLSQSRCPELAFEPWIRHLADRGFFS